MRTSGVHAAVVVHAAGLRQRGEQAPDGVQRVAHPALQGAGGGQTPVEQLCRETRDTRKGLDECLD